MAHNLTGSVGRWERGARNFEPDVREVQTLLASAAARLHNPAYDPKGVDGKIARPPKQSNTVAAIVQVDTCLTLVEDHPLTWLEHH